MVMLTELTGCYPTKNINALRILARHAIHGIKWRHHGIGVLQGYLPSLGDVEYRLHIWSPRLIKPGISESGSVHDHRFDMVSHVLAGTVGHEEWHATPSEDGYYEMFSVTHARAAEATKFHGPIMPTGQRYDARTIKVSIASGYTYEYPSRHFHRSTVPGFAVTLVEKHKQLDDVQARVLHPREIPPVMAFGHDMEPSLVADLVAQAAQSLS